MTPSRSVDDMTWWMYVRKHCGGDTNTRIAELVGITPSSVGRWGKGSKPDPSQAAAFARAYGRPVLEAFIAAGFLTPEEARETPSAPPTLASLDDDELLAEVRRRMQGGQSDAGTAEAEKSPDEVEAAGVLNRDDYDLAARRGASTGRAQWERAQTLGEESQDNGGWEPA